VAAARKAAKEAKIASNLKKKESRMLAKQGEPSIYLFHLFYINFYNNHTLF
jgi:hypothetical protein